MRTLVAAYFLVAALAAPALLWAADDPPADPAAATTPAPAAAPPPASLEPPPATPAKEDTAPETLKVTEDVRPAPKASAAASTSVPIEDFVYKPATVTLDVGDAIKWTNKDTAPHTATANDGSFDTGNLKKGESGSHKFTKAGTFAYICSLHPNMKAKVVVKAASSGNDDADSSGSEDTGSSDSSSSGSSDAPDDTFSLDSGSDDAAEDSSTLADTGGEIITTALLGLLFLGAGATLRRRLLDR